MSRHIWLIPLIFLIISFSCSSNIADTNDRSSFKPESVSDSVLVKIQDSVFCNLVSKFQIASLPFYYGYDSSNSRKFDLTQYSSIQERYDKARVPIDIAIKYFLEGDKELNKQPSGGIYEYYYGFRLPSNGDYILLFYFRPSGDTYSLRLATFNYEGRLIDDIGVAGGLGKFDPETQKECIINKDWTIDIEELSNIDYSSSRKNPDTGEYQYKVDRTDFVYQITPLGKFEQTKKELIGTFYYTERDLEVGGYKLIAPEGVTSLFDR